MNFKHLFFFFLHDLLNDFFFHLMKLKTLYLPCTELPTITEWPSLFFGLFLPSKFILFSSHAKFVLVNQNLTLKTVKLGV